MLPKLSLLFSGYYVTANVEKSENFLFLHFATAHMIFQLFRTQFSECLF